MGLSSPMKWIRRDIHLRAVIAAPAFALALAACSGGTTDVSSEATSTSPTAAVTTNADPGDTAAASTNSDTAAESEAPTTSNDASATPDEAPAPKSTILKLSAEEAIANAEINQPNLAGADDVLDIQTLAVADGSIQTLRDVVDGDRPVLLWFFSPH